MAARVEEPPASAVIVLEDSETEAEAEAEAEVEDSVSEHETDKEESAPKLATLRCLVSRKKFPVQDEWTTGEGAAKSLNIARIRGDYEGFVQSIAPVYERKLKTISTQRFEFGGNLSLLKKLSKFRHCGGGAEYPRDERVLFTPSRGRYCYEHLMQTQRFLWRISCFSVRVMVVPRDEMGLYIRALGSDWLFASLCDDEFANVGSARNCVIQLAHWWRMRYIWMIDDSVPLNKIRRFSLDFEPWTQDPSVKIREKRLDKKVWLPNALEDVEKCAKEKEFAIVGVPSRRSVLRAKQNSLGVNERAPTSMVYIDMHQVVPPSSSAFVQRRGQAKDPADLNYDSRLPHKEDVMFAMRLVDAGREIAIYRCIHLIDKRMKRGGCAPHH